MERQGKTTNRWTSPSHTHNHTHTHTLKTVEQLRFVGQLGRDGAQDQDQDVDQR